MVKVKKLNIKKYNPEGGLEKVTNKEEKITYTFDQAFDSSLKYFKGDDLAAKVWVNKYALKDSFGNIYESSPKQMHERLAGEIGRIENKYPNPISKEEIFSLLDHFKYIVPAGSSMSGIGNKHQVTSLSNCFVIGDKNPADSYGGIMKIDQEQIQLMKRRGGVGHDLSHIRPKNSPVKNSALSSTGIVPFMERYSNSTREVAQDGRRGALMLSMSIKHPDIEDFIDAKMQEGKITGANISVKIDDEFMNAVKNNEKYTQQFPINSNNPKVTKEIDAKKLWNKIVHNAWKSAEPGILFWDKIIKESVPDSYADLGYKTVSTNPCGEIPLCPYDSCRLLAMNLYNYVEKPFTSEANFNFNLFKKHVASAQRISDDIIDLEIEKIDSILEKIVSDPEDVEIKRTELNLWKNIKHTAKEGRRMGLGITGEGDMLAALNLRYGSENAIDFSVEVHKTLAVESYRSSVNLAKDRGAFKIYNSKREKDNPFIQRIKKEDEKLYKQMTEYGRRNIALLTIAPTGSTSIMTQTTSGIEPVFEASYKRRVKVNANDKEVNISDTDENGDSWEEYNVFHHNFETWLKINNYNVEEVKEYDEKKIQELVKQSPYYKATAQDVNWINKVKMQGKVQEWVDHSISATINLPEDTKEKLVGEIYFEAWKDGCKGVTVYRDGSRKGILNSKKENKKEGGLEKMFPDERPKSLDADIVRFKNNNENWIAIIGKIKNKPYEIFTGLVDDDTLPIPKSIDRGNIIKNKDEENNSRYDFQYVNKYGYKRTIEGLSYKFNKEFWNYAKLISGVLRQEMPIASVVNLVSSLTLNDESINNWKSGVKRALKKYVPDGTEAKGEVCPNCGADSLVYQEGCLVCKSCGSSKCG